LLEVVNWGSRFSDSLNSSFLGAGSGICRDVP